MFSPNIGLRSFTGVRGLLGPGTAYYPYAVGYGGYGCGLGYGYGCGYPGYGLGYGCGYPYGVYNPYSGLGLGYPY